MYYLARILDRAKRIKWSLRRLPGILSRMFLPNLYTPEGFRLTERQYVGLEHTVNLPPDRKRAVTICNLFSDQQKRIDEIAKLLDTSRGTVILVLIQEGLILDRRRQPSRDKDQRLSDLNGTWHLCVLKTASQQIQEIDSDGADPYPTNPDP